MRENMQVGYHGATRQNFDRDSIRVAVAELRNEHPKASETDLARLLADRMRDDDDLLMAAANYAVANAVNSIEKMMARARPALQVVAEREKAHAAKANMVASIKEQIMMLNLEMPNGKRMRWCTGAEMVKFGGAFAKIGKKVGASKTVGAVLDENQVRGYLK